MADDTLNTNPDQQTETIGFGLSGRGYMLSRSSAAQCRLNLQHYVWKDSFSFNIHPAVPMTPSTVLADIATGTGIWLVDVAGEHPTATLDGFDLDTTQAPHAHWLPPNILIRHWDIFTDPREEMVGKYDVVHVRLLVLVIPDQDPVPTIRRIYKLLKPGGYVQWDELHNADVQVRHPTSTSPTPALDHIRTMFHGNGRLDWTTRIPAAFESEGFTLITSEHFRDKPGMVRAAHELNMVTAEEFASRLVDEGQVEAGQQMRKAIERADHEVVSTGAALCVPRLVCVARKNLV